MFGLRGLLPSEVFFAFFTLRSKVLCKTAYNCIEMAGTHGGKRAGAGRKTVKPKVERVDKVQEVHEKALEKLDELWDLMYQQAQGVFVLVSPKARRAPEGATHVGSVEMVEECCPKCKQPKTDPREVWEVYKLAPDSTMLKYLHDQLAGRAAQKAAERVDPELHIYFGDIECDTTGTVGREEGIPSDPPLSGELGLGL